MKPDVSSLIGIRQLWSGSRRIVVMLTRNEGGSVAARCFLGDGETPIIDAPRAAEVLVTVRDVLDALICARRHCSRADATGLGGK